MSGVLSDIEGDGVMYAWLPVSGEAKGDGGLGMVAVSMASPGSLGVYWMI